MLLVCFIIIISFILANVGLHTNKCTGILLGKYISNTTPWRMLNIIKDRVWTAHILARRIAILQEKSWNAVKINQSITTLFWHYLLNPDRSRAGTKAAGNQGHTSKKKENWETKNNFPNICSARIAWKIWQVWYR